MHRIASGTGRLRRRLARSRWAGLPIPGAILTSALRPPGEPAYVGGDLSTLLLRLRMERDAIAQGGTGW